MKKMDRQTIARPRRLDSPRAKGQQRCRLRKSLFKSAHKYGVECDADVCVILRTQEDGRTFTFSTDSFDDFLPILQELVRMIIALIDQEAYSDRIDTIHLQLRRLQQILLAEWQIRRTHKKD